MNLTPHEWDLVKHALTGPGWTMGEKRSLIARVEGHNTVWCSGSYGVPMDYDPCFDPRTTRIYGACPICKRRLKLKWHAERDDPQNNGLALPLHKHPLTNC